jgi:hypothetical protein
MITLVEAMSAADNAFTDDDCLDIALNGYLVPFQNKRAALHYENMLLNKKKKLIKIKEEDLRDDRKMFPIKPFVQAKVKVNIFLRDIIKGANQYKDKLLGILGNMKGAYNDTACCWLLWSDALMGAGVEAECCAYYASLYSDD